MVQNNIPVCCCELSCGEDVVINLKTMEQDICNLSQKLAEGIVIPIACEKGPEIADKAIHRELKNIIIRLNDAQKSILLHHYIYSMILAHLDLMKNIKKENLN